MGFSTKLTIALGWQILIVTTTMGTRGYVWKEGNMPIADKPELLARPSDRKYRSFKIKRDQKQ